MEADNANNVSDTKGQKCWVAKCAYSPVDNVMINSLASPLNYSELTINQKNEKILKAGCGASRILRYYHERGYNIAGLDYINSNLKSAKPFFDN